MGRVVLWAVSELEVQAVALELSGEQQEDPAPTREGVKVFGVEGWSNLTSVGFSCYLLVSL